MKHFADPFSMPVFLQQSGLLPMEHVRDNRPYGHSPKLNCLLQRELEGQAPLPAPEPEKCHYCMMKRQSRRSFAVSAWGPSPPCPASPDCCSLPQTCCFGPSWLLWYPQDTSLSRFPFGGIRLSAAVQHFTEIHFFWDSSVQISLEFTLSTARAWSSF